MIGSGIWLLRENVLRLGDEILLKKWNLSSLRMWLVRTSILSSNVSVLNSQPWLKTTGGPCAEKLLTISLRNREQQKRVLN
jgi:hypothetical protein